MAKHLIKIMYATKKTVEKGRQAINFNILYEHLGVLHYESQNSATKYIITFNSILLKDIAPGLQGLYSTETV